MPPPVPTPPSVKSPARPRPRRLGVLGRALVPFFEAVRIDAEAAERLAEANRAGDVVYTLRAKRIIDPLYILYALHRQGLPLPAWMHDHGAGLAPPTVEGLLSSVEEGQPSLLFLRRPKTLTSRSAYSAKHVEALIAAQRERPRPIQLVPVALQWTREPVGLRRSVIDGIFGDREAPGAARELAGFFWQYRTAKFHVGAPVDLSAVIARDPDLENHRLAKKVRWTILHHLAREEHLRTGPVHRPASRTRQAVKNDPHVRKLVSSLTDQGHDPKQLEAKADRMLEKIAADMRFGWLRVLDALIDVIWNRIYDGIQVDPAGLELVRRAARKGPVVVVPSHKSHADYLVLSQLFFKNELVPPHIAAGENLDFWPVGLIFRRAGAFYIRRSFRGDKLYATVFGAYVRRLLREGHAVEFFIEGGRSRTGKLLAPKMGMLSMCAEPVLDGSIHDVSFIPVSIGYEKVIEAGSYAKELAGGKKKKEDVTALVSSAKILRSRYGRVYVDFDEPISLREFAAAREVELPVEDGGGRVQKNVIQQLGHRIVYGINRVTRVTPTSVAALVLLADVRRGMGEDELFERSDRALGHLREVGARLSGALVGEGRREAIREALGRFVQERLLATTSGPDGTLIYRIDEKGRIALDYYKNNILVFFVPAAVVAAATLAALDGERAPTDAVQDWARRISQLLKNEVSFRVGSTFEDNFEEASVVLEARGAIERSAEGYRVREGGEIELRELTGLLGVFFESYQVLGEVLEELDRGPMKEKELLEAALTSARRRALDGRLLRAEAASQPTLRQALSVYLAERAVTRGEGGTLEAGDPEARERVLSELATLLRTTTASSRAKGGR